MGKGQKRKNPGVGVDFRKVKHKVGKKLPKAQNETRTDFQARSINLPNQSITQDKTGAAVSERNLTLKVRWCLKLLPWCIYTAAAPVQSRTLATLHRCSMFEWHGVPCSCCLVSI